MSVTGKAEEGQDAAEVESSEESPMAEPPSIESPKDVDYEEMLEAYNHSFKNISEGAVVSGTILKVSDSHVVVDVGFKSEGRISVDEFRDEAGNLEIKPGDKVDVLLERTEDKHGHVVVSRQKAERMKVWDSLEKIYQDESIITGRVIERVKGGLAVDVGVRAFLPGSQVDLLPTRNLDSWCGQELRMRVIKVNRRRGNIVLSRKAVLEEEHYKLKEHTLKELEEGKVVAGIVKNITDYGAFVDLGGIDGLLHITDMSWGRVNHGRKSFFGVQTAER
jgi:small subunit ribosomal protein S1